MDDYEVVAADGSSVGRVAGERGANLVVEHGTIFKSRRAIPHAFLEVDAEARVVRASISKRLIEESPKLDDDVDDAEIARYYGLAGGGTSPATEGYGALNPDDPAIGAERQELASGLEPAASERARMREHPEQLEDRPGDLRKNPSPQHFGRRQAF